MSLPTEGDCIMVTTTAENGEVGKFIGVYAPEDGKFVLQSLTSKHYIQQLPMYPNQGNGWKYAIKWRKNEPVDPNQIRVDVWGEDRMEFPGGLDEEKYMHDMMAQRSSTPDPLMQEEDEEIGNTRQTYTKTFTWSPAEPKEKIPYDKSYGAIFEKVSTKPSLLTTITPNDGLTAEVLEMLMEHNGSWLYYVKTKYKTVEICTAAIRETPEALTFIPKKILSEDPIIYEIAVEHDPDLISQVPRNMLTEEMIRSALAKNENIRYSVKDRIGEIPDYIPLTRQISGTFTNQCDQGTCNRHAFSRVIIKNFFELILPLKADNTQETKCSQYLATKKFSGVSQLVTSKNCSFSGYIKILLFLHCFFLYNTYVPTQNGILPNSKITHIYEHLYESIELPHINQDQMHDLQNALHTIQKAQLKYGISLVTFHFRDVTLENIKKITDRGLYIDLIISERFSTEKHATHAVTIVGAFDEYMLIKNSWGDHTIYKFKFGQPLYLGLDKFDVLVTCCFVIPVIQQNNEEFKDLTNVDSYLQRYDELKSKFNSITVNVMNACPSKNKEPVECDDIPFRQQALIFHPDKNPRCVQEATEKFQKLNDLCNPTIPRQPLLIGQGTRKSRRRKSRRKKTRVQKSK